MFFSKLKRKDCDHIGLVQHKVEIADFDSAHAWHERLLYWHTKQPKLTRILYPVIPNSTEKDQVRYQNCGIYHFGGI